MEVLELHSSISWDSDHLWLFLLFFFQAFYKESSIKIVSELIFYYEIYYENLSILILILVQSLSIELLCIYL